MHPTPRHGEQEDMDRLPTDVWNAPIAGTNLTGVTLAGELGEAPRLLVFLRHLG